MRIHELEELEELLRVYCAEMVPASTLNHARKVLRDVQLALEDAEDGSR